MTDRELSEDELAELDDEAQIGLITQTDQGLLDDNQIPQPPQDRFFRPRQEGVMTA